jgi:transposase
MSDLFWLTDAQMARLEPFFPKSHGKPRVDDRRVLSGIIFINRNGLRWRDAPAEYGPHKTLYNRWKRWSDKGIFAQMMVGLAAEHGEERTVMIDATYLKAHRTATSLGVKRGARTPDWPNQGRYEYQAARHLRQPRTPSQPVRYSRASQRLHRRAGIGEQIAQSGLAAWRSGL